MYHIFNFAKLPHISHIIWDIDGTITDPDGDLSQEVAAKIINLAQRGVYHSFITGRDAKWIADHVIDPVRRFVYFPRVNNNLIFFAEVGCFRIDVSPTGEVSKNLIPQMQGHPLMDPHVRSQLRGLAYDPARLPEYQGGKIDADHKVIYDAGTGEDRKGFLVEVAESPKLHRYIWSEAKEAFATFEVTRDLEGKTQSFDQDPFVEIVRKQLRDLALDKDVAVEEVSTAINIVPKSDGNALGKAWAAGRALEYIRDVKTGGEQVLDAILPKTVAVGDGKADFDFTTPLFPPSERAHMTHSALPIIFVGPDVALPRDKELLSHMIIRGTGEGDLAYDSGKDVIQLQRAMGARVVSAVLDFLNEWGYFVQF